MNEQLTDRERLMEAARRGMLQTAYYGGRLPYNSDVQPEKLDPILPEIDDLLPLTEDAAAMTDEQAMDLVADELIATQNRLARAERLLELADEVAKGSIRDTWHFGADLGCDAARDPRAECTCGKAASDDRARAYLSARREEG